MHRRSFVRFGMTGVFGAGLVLAHGPEKHKGRPWKGEVVSVSKEQFTLQTGKGPRTVAVNKETKLERGDEPARYSELRKGARVTVFGTILASGEKMVAREILLGELKPRHHHDH